jgi:hypothetical protein
VQAPPDDLEHAVPTVGNVGGQSATEAQLPSLIDHLPPTHQPWTVPTQSVFHMQPV